MLVFSIPSSDAEGTPVFGWLSASFCTLAVSEGIPEDMVRTEMVERYSFGSVVLDVVLRFEASGRKIDGRIYRVIEREEEEVIRRYVK